MTTPKIALVTGGSRGLGKSMALALAQKGIDVILTYNTKEAEALDVARSLEALGRKAAALPLDVSQAASFPDFAARLQDVLRTHFGTSGFDFLVNNAGIGLYNPVAETTEEQFDTLSAIHLKAPIFLTQRLLPLLRDGGGIVNISTGLTRLTLPGYAAYASMKAAVETLTRYMAREFGPRKIRVNAVAPGAIETDFGGGRVRDNAELNRHIAEATALGRVGLPEDIGGVVAFLCSDDARWITAQRIEVSGGQML